MSVENIAKLKKEVEKVFGKKILSATDCQSLTVDIYRQTELRISVNTLRRMFNLMKNKYQPSLFSLDLLSKYCSFSSFSDFISSVNEKSISNQNMGTRLLNLLIFLFKDIDTKGIREATYKQIIHEIIINLDQCPDLLDQFHREIAKTVNGQKYYFEQFINIDGLNQSYGKGLGYYLNEKKTEEAKLFAHSLLCFNSWLTMNREGVKRHCNEVSHLSHYYSNDETIDPFIQGRIFAAQLFAANITHAEITPVLIQARNFYTRKKSSICISQKFPSFEFVLSETLVLINEYEEALFYIEEAIKNGKHDLHSPHDDLRHLESVYLYKAIALANIGEEEKSMEVLEKISPSNFHFLSKKFNMILFLLLKQRFQKSEDLYEKIKYFVKQTGFKKLIIKQLEYEATVFSSLK